ncbi:hypothetical protein RTBOTA2_003684 [Rhodotorula toruloides]|nr:hypothetical protein RTBOTA2_003684 [Rhodotorula toruloides]
MPADRTNLRTTSPAVQATAGPAARPAPSLGRGRACLSCRKRKVKCDAVQPVCGPCIALAARTGQDMSTIKCDFDSEEERRKPVGGGKVAALEAKIAALERRLAEVSSPQGSPSPTATGLTTASRDSTPTIPLNPVRDPTLPFDSFASTSTSTQVLPSLNSLVAATGHYSALPDQSLLQHHLGLPAQPFPAHQPFPGPPPALPGLGSHMLPLQAHEQQHYHFPQPPTASTSAAPVPSALPQPLPPAAPPPPPQQNPETYFLRDPPLLPFDSVPPTLIPEGPRLPSYPTLSRLVNIFFDVPHEAIDLINRRRFLDGFSQPPDHPDYPAKCLLHAMVATATDLAGDEPWQGEERYWPEGQSPAVYHADLADVLIPLGFRSESNLLQVAQAAVLFACLNLYHGRFSRGYIDTATAVRICTSLGLNHDHPGTADLPVGSFLAHRTLLPPPRDEEEAQERAVAWWFAWTCETFSMASTGWACCIDERDVTVLLPAAGPRGDDAQDREALYLHSPSFFVTNPPHLVRLVQINLKVTVLMNRVCTFVHRTSALANATPDRQPLNPADFPKIRSSPAFTKLEAALENFGRKAPAQLVTLLEPEAFLCPSLVATSVILLHERFCTSEEGDPSMVKCTEAANNIVANMQVLNSASFHPRQIPPFLTFCWGVAGRTFLREIAIRQLRGVYDSEEVQRWRASVQGIIARLEQTRTPVGPLIAATLAALLRQPEICLPEADLTARQPGTRTMRLRSLLEMTNPAILMV